VPFAGHHSFEYFVKGRALRTLIPKLIATRNRDVKSLVALRRTLRRGSGQYWSNLSEIASEKNRLKLAVSAAKKAIELEAGAVLHRHRYALALALSGRMDEALKTWREVVSDPQTAGAMWWRMSQAAARFNLTRLQNICATRSFSGSS
jgi:predicted Zn-dependent protease